jgi:hypothetical protein
MQSVRLQAQGIPAELSDAAFWQMVSEFSEPDGPFDSDNFTSNEDGYQWPIPRLKQLAPSSVYLGVGPEQNFSYIAALRPKLAFIVDIRRQNMIELLLYKAMFEMSTDRADFLSRLLSRPLPAGVGAGSSAEELFAAFQATPADAALYKKNLTAVTNRLIGVHKFHLSTDDIAKLHYVAEAFFNNGPDIHYVNPGQPNARQPTFTSLMTSRDSSGENSSFLANETNFKVVKDLQQRNLIIPVVGNFAGDKALRRIGQYIRDRGAVVTAFYTSNVERYLFAQSVNRTIAVDPGEDWKRLYTNVAAFPIEDTSVFIRVVTSSILRSLGVERAAEEVPVLGSAGDFFPLLEPMKPMMEAWSAGKIQTYRQILEKR